MTTLNNNILNNTNVTKEDLTTGYSIIMLSALNGSVVSFNEHKITNVTETNVMYNTNDTTVFQYNKISKRRMSVKKLLLRLNEEIKDLNKETVVWRLNN